jgi:hypothetical protein
MTNDEIRMTNQTASPNVEPGQAAAGESLAHAVSCSLLLFGGSFVIRVSDFVIGSAITVVLKG